MTANGTLADNQLVPFYGVRLAPKAAADAARMVNAATLAGHVIRPLTVREQASGYRSRGTQGNMITAQATGHAADYRLLPHPPAPPLAPVGYSRHGQGRACDWVWSSPAALAWLHAHGAEYGWTFWNALADPPHMEHDAGHDVATWTEPTLAPAGQDISELVRKENDMIIFQSISASADGVIPNGVGFLRTDGPLQALSKAESDAYTFFADHGIPVAVAQWSGDDIRKLSKSVGLLQFTMPADLYPVFTGKVIYVDPTKADYPRVSGVGGSSAPADYFSDADAAAQLKAITDAVAAGDTKVLAAISTADDTFLASLGLQRIKA